MEFSRSVLEAASWRLASELVRRNPTVITVYQVHAVGGMADTLRVVSDGGARTVLNRNGSIQVQSRHSHGGATSQAQAGAIHKLDWRDYLGAPDPRDLANRLTELAGLPVPQRLPASTAPVLVFRLLAAIAGLAVLAQPVSITMGMTDTDSFSGSAPAPWWREVVGPAGSLATPTKADASRGLDPAYRWWRVVHQDFTLTLETSTAAVWVHGPAKSSTSPSGTTLDGATRIDLVNRYDSVGRSIPRLLASLLA